MAGAQGTDPPKVTVVSIITCPSCGHQQEERLPEFSCTISYQCVRCGATLRPVPGDCCVFCSYGSVPCPAIQIARHDQRG